MTEKTPLDAAHIAMEADKSNDVARLRFFERLADSELFLMLKEEPNGDQILPEIFEVQDTHFVLVFDREARLSEFAEGIAPYAALSGRAVVEMLEGQGVGLGVNLGVAPSSILIPPDAVSWLSETLSQRPEEVSETPESFEPPKGLPEKLIVALDTKLATATGLAASAYLVTVVYEGGRRGHMLGYVDPVPGAETALAQATGEALTFSGVEAGVIDVAFFRASDPLCAQLARVGLRFDLPEPVKTETPKAPGSDPKKPPILW